MLHRILVHVLWAGITGTIAAQSSCEQVDISEGILWSDGQQYAHGVALRGDRLAVGRRYGPYIVGPKSNPGSVFLYRRDGEAWVSDGVVLGSDDDGDDDFGFSVAVENDRLLVGAVTNGWFNSKGAVYAFERQGEGVWGETQKLVPDEAQAIAVGWSVAIDGDTAVIGAKGAVALGLGWGRAYVYEYQGGAWQLEQELLPSFSAVGDSFGISVDVEGDRIVVGSSYQFTQISPNPGWAFVFEKQAGTWVETEVLIGSDTVDDDLFGHSVALDGNRIAVGAFGHDDLIGNAGAVYVFEESGDAWTEVVQLTGGPDTYTLGYSVDIGPSMVLAGAYADFGAGPYHGTGFLFEEDGGTWNLASKFWGSKLVEDSTFGNAMDLDGDQFVVGAAGLTGALPGAAYVFSLTPGAHLTTDANELSLSAGDQQTLHLGGCPDNAGDLYAVAGTASGTSPGFSFGGVPVPLNPDAYFLHTVNHPAGPPLSGAVGFLDAFGCAEATFGFAPGTDPSLAGTVLHHAWARLDPATLALEAVSPAAQVALVP